MDQHLVHHHLEEQRREQREQLQAQRGDQHFAQHLAVFDDGRDEPGEVEARQFAGLRGIGTEQDQLPVPALMQGMHLQHFGALGAGYLDQHALTICAGKDEEPAIPVAGDGGQRGAGKPLAAGLDGLGAQVQPARGQQQLVQPERACAIAELMAQLFGIGGDVVEAGQRYQAFQSAVGGFVGRVLRCHWLLPAACPPRDHSGASAQCRVFRVLLIARRSQPCSVVRGFMDRGGVPASLWGMSQRSGNATLSPIFSRTVRPRGALHHRATYPRCGAIGNVSNVEKFLFLKVSRRS